MNIFEFMSNSPFLSFFLFWILASFLQFAIKMPFRYMNIRRHGYPPAHCDADGDLKEDAKESN